MNKQEAQFFKEQAINDLLSFCVFTDKFFDIVEIHSIMADALMKVESGEIKKLILELPPRSGKSRITSEFIAWLLGRNPRKDILLTGHSSSLLETFSRNIRNRIESDEYKQLFNTRLAEGNTAVKSWKVKDGGEFSIFGVGGGITGKGGHILVIDDPYSGREEAESQTTKEKVWDWYKSTFLSRRQNEDSAIIIIMQRWGEDDLVGRILEEDKKKEWTEVKIPAINSEGESFWSSKFSVEYLEEMRQEIGDYFFSSQYQQDPINLSGGDFKKEYFEYYETIEQLKHRLDIVTFLDPAISQKQEADNTAIITVGTDIESNLVYLLEVKKLKETPDVIIDELFNTVKSYRNYGRSYRAGIEVVAYQKMLALEIKKQMRLRDCFFTLEEVNPQGEKEARIRSILQPRYAGHSIIHPKYGANIQDLELELLKFPNGKHDDMIDALASSLNVSRVSNQNKTKIFVPNHNLLG